MPKKTPALRSTHPKLMVTRTENDLLKVTGKNTDLLFEKFAQHAEKTAPPIDWIVNKSHSFSDDQEFLKNVHPLPQESIH
jgi:hypothetical protein